MRALRSAGSPPISRLKARRAETVLSYSWCLGRFIKRVRHGADYFSGNKESRKAESTVCLQLLLERFSRARLGRGQAAQRAARAAHCGRAFSLPSGFQGPESRRAHLCRACSSALSVSCREPVRGTWDERKHARSGPAVAPCPSLDGPRPCSAHWPSSAAAPSPRALGGFYFPLLLLFPKTGTRKRTLRQLQILYNESDYILRH